MSEVMGRALSGRGQVERSDRAAAPERPPARPVADADSHRAAPANKAPSRYGGERKSNVVGLSVVALLHVLVIYALVSGLAKKVVDVVRAPIETRVIEEVHKPPPPPDFVPPPPKLEAPPPPFIPPPEVQISAPPPPQPTITATTPTPPPAPVEFAPAVPVATAPPAPPAPPVAKPATLSIGVACPTMVPPVIPRRALQEGLGGLVRARATIRGGKVVEVEILSAKPRGVFDAAVRTAMLQYVCETPADQDVSAEQTFNFKQGD